MAARHLHKKRGLALSDKSNSMVNNNERKFEFFDGLLGNPVQLMLGHCLVRLVLDSVDFAAVFSVANNAPKIDYRTDCKIDILLWGFELRFRQYNFANWICHAL